MQDSDPAVPPRKFIAESPAAVGTAVVHKNQLNVLKGLGQNAVHTSAKQFFRIVNWDDDTDNRHILSSAADQLSASSVNRSSISRTILVPSKKALRR